MTARERAARFSWRHCPGGDGHEGEPGGISYAWICPACHAAAFEECEAAAYERVVEHFDRLRSTVTPVNGMPAKWAADVVRSLATKEDHHG